MKAAARSKSAQEDENLKFFSNKSGKALITTRVAQEIYLIYKNKEASGAVWTPTVTSEELANKYGITAKAIRDIWNKRTWRHATVKYWTEEEKRQFNNKPKPREKMTANELEQRTHTAAELISLPASPDTLSQSAHSGGIKVDKNESVSSVSRSEEQENEGWQEDVEVATSSSNIQHSRPSFETQDDGWMTCPSRIGMFISSIPSVELK
ncbi:hypothetical protein GUITHDRAFT_115906 [Guillardia theta CCMP2712]|uniref:Uncharacterized protein n=2 Tax=Guillardia theta TaxID=55529 RepID=L1IPW6_GUITC|nr:hypothetical protein GUITHDRAFT_115906 [Guillardia theta CCMP2712]EKX37934.1 hypothetical protein GUITHDRAFT_115906 [Guillardia theta CCMP2712]|mmetsp:Transcript_32834/g.103834  ORF Transcript_32834/g.103834 Transcript_32834/m.103834 type:complete len:209 (+) Transcript_32834:188-814(+)|eukprot:XP_005824914.1 hypothetical protein GUITHDRAFT_115906 [Guillardia theta CCMP2712]